MIGLRWGCEGGVYELLRFFGAMIGYDVCDVLVTESLLNLVLDAT
jgi:hypothetical protein